MVGPIILGVVIAQDIVAAAAQTCIRPLQVHVQYARLRLWVIVIHKPPAQQQVDIGAIIIASLRLVHHNKTQQTRQPLRLKVHIQVWVVLYPM